MSNRKAEWGFATAFALATLLVACSGRIQDVSDDAGDGTDAAVTTSGGCTPSECGANTFHCPNGAPTDVSCGPVKGGGSVCAWSGACPGDCNPSKCANQAAGCAQGEPANVRCVPNPMAGQGSMPADACELIFQCVQGGSGPVSGASDASVSTEPPVEVDGGVAVGACTWADCAGQAIVCLSGEARDVRCVPDPYGGQGSDPAAHCVLEGYCPAVTDAGAYDGSYWEDASIGYDASFPYYDAAYPDAEEPDGGIR